MTTETTTKKQSIASKVREYKKANPKALPKEVSKALGIPVARIYAINNYEKKRAQRLKAKKKAMATKQVGVDNLPKVGDTIGGLTLTRKALNDGTYVYRWVREDIVKSGKVLVDDPTSAPKADNVNHPAHYKVGGIETIDFIEAKQLNYNLGNVVKYITRADHKGNTQEDLLKARWYLNREIAKMNKGAK